MAAHNEYEPQNFDNIRLWICETDPESKLELDGLSDPNRFLSSTAALVDQVRAFSIDSVSTLRGY